MTKLLKLLLWLAMTAGGSPSQTLTVTGVSPLALVNALAHEIKSLTQYGKCTQASTPTPSAPVDIVCNNGALRMVDDELPAAYKRVLGFACDNNALWEITGFHLKGSDTVRISFSINAACNVFGCYQGADADDNYDLYVSTTSGSKYFRYGNGTYLSYWSSSNLGQRFDVTYTPNGSQGMPQDSTWAPNTFTSANDLLIGATTLTGTSSKLKGNLYGNIVVDGRLKLIPCERLSDNVLGYYDTFSETFYEPYTGFAGAVSLGYDGSHYSLAVVGTPEVLTIAPLGSATQDGTPSQTKFVPVVGTKLGNTELLAVGSDRDTFDAAAQTITRVIGSVTLNGTESIGKSSAYGAAFYIASASATWGAIRSKAVLCTHFVGAPPPSSQQVEGTCFFNASGHFYLRVSDNSDPTAFKTWLAAQYDAGTPVVVYFVKSTPATEAYTGTPVDSTASVESLFAVGDYADEQGIISGLITRKVGVAVLDGTETVSASGVGWALPIADKLKSGAFLWCSHYPYSSVSMASAPDKCIKNFASQNIGFKDSAFTSKTDVTDFFAAQYAAGTPVIVVYPLAEETTEHVAAQPLNSYEGASSVVVTSNVDPVTLEVEYKGKETE